MLLDFHAEHVCTIVRVFAAGERPPAPYLFSMTLVRGRTGHLVHGLSTDRMGLLLGRENRRRLRAALFNQGVEVLEWERFNPNLPDRAVRYDVRDDRLLP